MYMNVALGCEYLKSYSLLRNQTQFILRNNNHIHCMNTEPMRHFSSILYSAFVFETLYALYT